MNQPPTWKIHPLGYLLIAVVVTILITVVATGPMKIVPWDEVAKRVAFIGLFVAMLVALFAGDLTIAVAKFKHWRANRQSRR